MPGPRGYGTNNASREHRHADGGHVIDGDRGIERRANAQLLEEWRDAERAAVVADLSAHEANKAAVAAGRAAEAAATTEAVAQTGLNAARDTADTAARGTDEAVRAADI